MRQAPRTGWFKTLLICDSRRVGTGSRQSSAKEIRRGSFGGPTFDKLTTYLSIIDHWDDFGKGIIDTTHLIYYLRFIAFGLFLTAKSVDSERWRG